MAIAVANGALADGLVPNQADKRHVCLCGPAAEPRAPLASGSTPAVRAICELLAPTVFTAVLFFGHLPFDDGKFFLDIACIPQDDATKKASGKKKSYGGSDSGAKL